MSGLGGPMNEGLRGPPRGPPAFGMIGMPTDRPPWVQRGMGQSMGPPPNMRGPPPPPPGRLIFPLEFIN